MADKKELIWVEAEYAKKHEKLISEKAERDRRLEVFNGYLEKIEEESRFDFKASLETLEEDAAIYTGLMLNVKRTFEKAKDEALSTSYTCWEKWQEDMPRVQGKTQKILAELTPLTEELEKIDKLLKSINTYGFDKVISTIREISGLYEKEKEMVDFLVANFKKEE